jgi:tRNA pseudouridine55 synthase
MDGLVLVRKFAGPTSHDIVARLRHILGTRKIGHYGTLDPFAEGLLIAAVGKATRLFPFFGVSDKTYEGRLRLGTSTDTYDFTGRPLDVLSGALPDKAALITAMARFQGDLIQLAPPFSAKKLNGKPLYNYARKRIEVERRPAPIRIDRFVLRSFEPPDLDFEVACSAGTYIRALAHDLGVVLGCGAHLTRLIRTVSGSFRVENARTLEEIEAAFAEGRPDRFLTPLEALLPHFPKAELTAAGRALVRNGRPVDLSDRSVVAAIDSFSAPEAIIRLFDPEERLIALARRRESDGAPFLVLI